MRHLDLTFDAAEHNLACDEALLDLCEDGSSDEILRFWEPKDPFVVVGYSNKIQTEVAITSCKLSRIPVLRRTSGGGTVLQGPGCLNYSLILKIPEKGPLRSLTETNHYVLNRHQKALEALLPEIPQIRGTSDLTLGNLKFSGNAQRRKKNTLLFHGTFLLKFDLSEISRLLTMPSRQPDYRQNRAHAEFLTNIPLSPDTLKNALRIAWEAEKPLEKIPLERIHQLVQEKYGRNDWNEKF